MEFMKYKDIQEFKLSILVTYLDEIIIFLENDYQLNIDTIWDSFMEEDFNRKFYHIPHVARELNKFKNGSLYSDYNDSKFKKPSENIDGSVCDLGIALAKIQKKIIELPNIHKDGFRLDEISEDEYLKTVYELIDKLEQVSGSVSMIQED